MKRPPVHHTLLQRRKLEATKKTEQVRARARLRGDIVTS